MKLKTVRHSRPQGGGHIFHVRQNRCTFFFSWLQFSSGINRPFLLKRSSLRKLPSANSLALLQRTSILLYINSLSVRGLNLLGWEMRSSSDNWVLIKTQVIKSIICFIRIEIRDQKLNPKIENKKKLEYSKINVHQN